MENDKTTEIVSESVADNKKDEKSTAKKRTTRRKRNTSDAKPAAKRNTSKKSDTDNVKSSSKSDIVIFKTILHPSLIYCDKSLNSPVIGRAIGKCRIISQDGDWWNVTVGINGVGAVNGYVYKPQAPII